MMQLWMCEPDYEEVDDSNVVQLNERRTVKVQVEEELEVVDDELGGAVGDAIQGHLDRMDKIIENAHKQFDETNKIFQRMMGKDHPLVNTRAKRTGEKGQDQ